MRNLKAQLERLVTQLADLEECRDDLEEGEYEETKTETLSQLAEFSSSLERAAAGDMTLTDQLTAVKLATQQAISNAFRTPEVMQMFAKQEPAQLRCLLAQIARDGSLGKKTQEQCRSEKVDIISALKKLGAELLPEEAALLENSENLQIVDQNSVVGEHVLSLLNSSSVC